MRPMSSTTVYFSDGLKLRVDGGLDETVGKLSGDEWVRFQHVGGGDRGVYIRRDRVAYVEEDPERASRSQFSRP